MLTCTFWSGHSGVFLASSQVVLRDDSLSSWVWPGKTPAERDVALHEPPMGSKRLPNVDCSMAPFTVPWPQVGNVTCYAVCAGGAQAESGRWPRDPRAFLDAAGTGEAKLRAEVWGLAAPSAPRSLSSGGGWRQPQSQDPQRELCSRAEPQSRRKPAHTTRLEEAQGPPLVVSSLFPSSGRWAPVLLSFLGPGWGLSGVGAGAYWRFLSFSFSST